MNDERKQFEPNVEPINDDALLRWLAGDMARSRESISKCIKQKDPSSSMLPRSHLPYSEFKSFCFRHARMQTNIVRLRDESKKMYLSGKLSKKAWTLRMEQVCSIQESLLFFGRLIQAWPKEVSSAGLECSATFPRLWELLGWVLPSKLRRTVYEPYRQELLEDYLVSRKQSRTSAARWWLFICYTLWTVYAVVLSILAGLSSVAGQRLMRLLPQRWRRWWLP